MSNSRDDGRDITLTTLVDLLVQIVFVFTLVLIVSGATEGDAEERGYIAPEAWKTLVSIFDVDPKGTPKEQIGEIKSKYEAILKDRDALRKILDEQDVKISELERKTGAPGLPSCRARDGHKEHVLDTNIDAGGRIVAVPSSGAEALEPSGLTFGKAGQILSQREFQQEFAGWREHGLSRDPKCKYMAKVEYDPNAAAGDYQPAIQTIYSIFNFTKIIKQR